MGEEYETMVREEPKVDRKLTEQQLRILKLIHKFRFVSAPLLAEVLGKSKSSIFGSLEVLVRHEYLGKRYEKSFKLRHIPAIYYLANKSIRVLRDLEHPSITDKSLRNMYKSKHMNKNLPYVERSFRLISIYISLRRHYGDLFHIFTKSELTGYEEFPLPRPDLYLRRAKTKEAKVNEFMLSVLEPGLPYFIYAKQIRRFQNHEEEEGWEDDDYPCILLVAPSESVEKRLLKTIHNSIQDFDFYTTTIDRLLAIENDKAIWADAFEGGKLLTISNLERQ